jgi:hypothetical protein
VTGRSPLSKPAGPPETLADALAGGPLALAAGLRCANEIAVELRDLHLQHRAYGKLSVNNVIMAESGAHLAPLRNNWDETNQQRDVQAFGAVFYEILTGTPPPVNPAAADPRIQGSRPGPSRLRSSAMLLALKCLTSKVAKVTMQQMATEIRLLGILLRQHEANARYEPPPAPFLVTPTQAPAASMSPLGGDVGEADAPLSTRSMGAMGETGAAPIVRPGRESFGRPEPKTPAELEPAGGRCPKCDSQGVCASRPRSRFEQMMQSWGIPICRCHRCSHRYVVFARFKIAKDLPVEMDPKYRARDRRY